MLDTASISQSSDTFDRELHLMHDYLTERVIGQEQAAKVFSSVFIRGELGLANSGRPRGVILALGPTGVGKTEMTLNCGKFLYGENFKERFVRFDMAEFSEHRSLGLLLGSSLTEEGLMGHAIDKLNAAGGGIILCDEIEKAHPDLVKVFLGINDAARVRMANGQEKNCESCYLVFTSNLGTAEAINLRSAPFTTVQRIVLATAEDFFAPEQLARFPEKVVFRALEFDQLTTICSGVLDAEIARMQSIAGVPIEIEDRKVLLRYLVKVGFTRALGARPMRNSVEREIQNAMSTWILDPEKGDSIILRMQANVGIVAESPPRV